MCKPLEASNVYYEVDRLIINWISIVYEVCLWETSLNAEFNNCAQAVGTGFLPSMIFGSYMFSCSNQWSQYTRVPFTQGTQHQRCHLTFCIDGSITGQPLSLTFGAITGLVIYLLKVSLLSILSGTSPLTEKRCPLRID